jgi:hypothetical protein
MEVAAVSLEQGHSQVPLESLCLLAERGPRDVKPLRIAADVELLRDRHEVLDQPKVQALH